MIDPLLEPLLGKAGGSSMSDPSIRARVLRQLAEAEFCPPRELAAASLIAFANDSMDDAAAPEVTIVRRAIQNRACSDQLDKLVEAERAGRTDASQLLPEGLPRRSAFPPVLRPCLGENNRLGRFARVPVRDAVRATEQVLKTDQAVSRNYEEWKGELPFASVRLSRISAQRRSRSREDWSDWPKLLPLMIGIAILLIVLKAYSSHDPRMPRGNEPPIIARPVVRPPLPTPPSVRQFTPTTSGSTLLAPPDIPASGTQGRTDHPWVGEAVYLKKAPCPTRTDSSEVIVGVRRPAQSMDVVAVHEKWVRVASADVLGNRDKEIWLPMNRVLPAEEAIEFFDFVVTENPHARHGNQHAYLTLATIHKDLGNTEQAIGVLDRAIEAGFDTAKSFVEKADLHILLEQNEQAIAALTEAIHREPEAERYYCHRGRANLRAGNYREAVDDYTTAIDLNHVESHVFSNRGYCLKRLGELEAAVDDFGIALEKNPRSTYSLRHRGDTYRVLKQYERAVIDYASAIELEPTEYLFAARGYSHSKLGDYTTAISDYDSALELIPSYVWVHQQRGEAHINLKQYRDAASDYSRAIALKPDSTFYFTKRAWCHLKDGRNEQAIADYTTAIDLGSNDWDAFSGRGSAYYRTGEIALAKRDFEIAVSVAPHEKLPRSNLVSCFVDVGDFSEAIVHMTVLIAKFPRDAKLYSRRALLWSEAGEIHRALDDAEAAINLAPDTYYFYDIRAEVLSSAEQYLEAYRVRDTALKKFPESAEATSNLAWFLATCPEAKLRDGARAVELATRACEATEFQEAFYIDTLAAAYAELGDFDEAVRHGTLAIEIAPESLLDDLQMRLEVYRRNEPFRSKR